MRLALSSKKQTVQIFQALGLFIILLALPLHPDFAGGATVTQQSVSYGDNPVAGHYQQVGDARIYYEIYGNGEPLVLLHGGLFGSIGEFRGIISDLSRDHMVIAIATRGHGRSELGLQPLSYRLFAEDFAAVIRKITARPVDVLGFSDGAISAYHLASAHPEIVRRLIAVGGPLGSYGYTEAGITELNKYDTPEKLEKLAPKFVASRRKAIPDGAAWNRFLEELVKMWRQREYISREQVRMIQGSVLIAGGDRDAYTKTEHLVEIYRLLPKGQLAVVPHSGHTVFGSKPDVMLKLVRDFLKE